MTEKFRGPEGFVPKEITLVSKVEIVPDPELKDAQKLNDLIKQKADLLEAGPERGNELEFGNKLDDIEEMIEKLGKKV